MSSPPYYLPLVQAGNECLLWVGSSSSQNVEAVARRRLTDEWQVTVALRPDLVEQATGCKGRRGATIRPNLGFDTAAERRS